MAEEQLSRLPDREVYDRYEAALKAHANAETVEERGTVMRQQIMPLNDELNRRYPPAPEPLQLTGEGLENLPPSDAPLG